jgi:uncharacterized protein YjdB/beta-glucanase (GH16 family)
MRKGLLFLFFALIATVVSHTTSAQCTTLVWYDEFEGTTLDQSKWAYVLGRGCDQPSGCGFGNGEEQAYTNQSKNITVGGGNLTITALFDNPEPGAAFSSAKIQTLGLKTFQYGKIETRMKLSSGQGAWPAFWMLAQSNNWPYTGEIDIMEAKHKNPTQLIGTVHHYNGHNSGQVATPDLSAAFHTYAIEWEKDEIRWYFDGALYHRATPQTTGGAWPFNNTGNPFYLIYNLAVGGLGTPFTGNQPFNSADFPTNIQVDYVRVYSGTWNVEFNGDPYVYKGENSKVYSVTPVAGAGYNWTVPAGATIASGQGTNQITVNFGTSAASGNISVAVTSGCATQTYLKAVTVEEAFKITSTLKDWDANNNMTFVSASGTLTQVANPAGSGNVGRYVRNGAQLYDNIIHKNIAFGNASDFLTRRRRIRADIYTSAPVGTKIRIQLENAAKSSQTFPIGRHSVHETRTTRQNAWETVEFEYVNSPDLGTGSTTVDQLAILFAVETNSSDTYYIDNIVIGTAGDLCPRILNQTLEDFQTNRNITYNSSTGTLTTVSNPAPGGVNTSSTVGRYARNGAEQYDVLFYRNVSLNNVANFKNGKSVFKMQVYSGAPIGTTISLQLETSASTPSNYPTGRHSLYQGVTASQNQWETIEFSYVSSLDALAQDSQVNSIVFLFSPGTNNASVYHFDNLITEAENCNNVVVTGVTVSPTSASKAVGTTQQLMATVAPTNATNKNVTWSSSNAAVATVNSSGLVTAVAAGTATITVTTQDQGKTATSTITVTSNPGVPSPWLTADIGAVGVAGNASHSGSTFTAQGSGADIWGTADEFRYIHQTVSGDVTITARVASLGNTDPWAKAGVMIRETTAANSRHAFTGVTVGNGLAFQRRLTAGAESEHTAGPAGTVPYWVRLTRAGNVISSFVSTNGTTWTQVGAATTITMATAVQVGLAVTSHNDAVLNTATFDNVTVSTGNVAVTGVTMSPTSASVNVGATQQLTATVAPANATNKNVTWSTSNGSIATVSSTGLVTGVAAGSATITVTTQDGNRTATSAITVNSVPTGTDITNVAGGIVTAQWDDSPAAERFPTLIDNNVNTKYLTFHNAGWVQFQAPSSYIVNRYTITSANDAPERDPLNWTLQGSTNGSTWVTMNTQSAQDFPSRLQTRSFTFTNTTGFTYYRFNLTNNSGTLLQLAEFELFGTPVSNGVCKGNGPIASGQSVPDYSYEISTNGNVSVKFIPGTPIAGCDMAIFYYRIGTGGYVGTGLTASAGTFTSSVSIPNGSAIQFYFTYRRSAGGMESNSSASPHSYTVGTTCAGAASLPGATHIVQEDFDEDLIEVYPNPANDALHFRFAKTFDGGVITIVDAVGKERTMRVNDSKGTIDVSAFTPGLYILRVSKESRSSIKRFIKE